jgi:hypothetical protein
MALGPINYQMQVATPFESVLQGMSAGAKMADIEAARMQREAQAAAIQQKTALKQQEADRLNAFERARTAYFANPNRSGEDFDRLLAQSPDKEALDALKAAAESRGTERLINDKRFYGQLLTAIEVNPATAKSILESRIAGTQDANEKQGFQLALKALDVSPEKAAEITELLAGASFGKDWVDTIANARKARREVKEGPINLRKLEADAKKAETELVTLGKIKDAELRKAESDADRLAIQAKFAERTAQAELRLKDAQTASSRASAAKTTAETEDLKRKATEGPLPEYNAQAGGFIIKPSKGNPTGGFVPLPQVQNVKDQQAAVKALRTAGYDPETGEDTISKLIERSTSGGLQAVSAAAANKLGFSTTGSMAIRELAAAASSIATDMLGGKLGAGISNTDRDFIVAGLGSIADPTIPFEDRLAAWGSVKNRLILTGVLPPPTRRPGSRPPAPASAVGVEAETPAIDALLEKYPQE